MRGARSIGIDALAWMEGFGVFRSCGLFWFLGGNGFGTFARGVKQRKILNRAGPGDFGIVEGGVAARSGGQFGPRENQDSGIDESCGGNSAAREAWFDVTIAEDREFRRIVGETFALEKDRDAAEKILMEAVPGDIEFGFDLAGKKNGNVVRFGLAQQIEGIDGLLSDSGLRLFRFG